jgi:hypothetical protein
MGAIMPFALPISVQPDEDERNIGTRRQRRRAFNCIFCNRRQVSQAHCGKHGCALGAVFQTQIAGATGFERDRRGDFGAASAKIGVAADRVRPVVHQQGVIHKQATHAGADQTERVNAAFGRCEACGEARRELTWIDAGCNVAEPDLLAAFHRRPMNRIAGQVWRVVVDNREPVSAAVARLDQFSIQAGKLSVVGAPDLVSQVA